MNRKGYVSFEVVVIVALIFAAGLFLLSQFILDADVAAEESIVTFEDTYVETVMDGDSVFNSN